MKRVELSKNIIAYQHEGKTKDTLGFNSYIFLNGKEALVIDTTYPEYLTLIVEDLKKDNITIKKAMPSHYHPDHIEGINILENVEIYGTEFSLKTLNKMGYSDKEKNELQPTTLIKEGGIVKFGEHTFEFIITHGHSACSMFILINNMYLHVGDTYMTSNSGEHSLPSVSWAGVSDHISALNKLYEYFNQSILVSHGHLTNSINEMTIGIRDRIVYLQALLDSNNEVSAKDAIMNTKNEFINQSWREYVK